MQSLHRVEKSPPSDGTGNIGAGDLSTQSIIGAVTVCPIPTRSPARDDGDGERPYRHVKKGARLAPESLAVRMQKKRSPSF